MKKVRTGFAKRMLSILSLVGLGVIANAQCSLFATDSVMGLNTPYSIAVSPDGNTVYVVNNSGPNAGVRVIDASTNTVTGAIPIVNSPAGIVVSPDGSRVYVPNNNSGTVIVIDAVTNMVTDTIGVGNSPQGIAISPDGSQVYVANWNDNTVSVIDATTNTVITTIGVGSHPFAVAVSPDGSKVYVSNQVGYTVNIIDVATNTVTNTINISSGDQLRGIAVSPDGSMIYVVNTGNSTGNSNIAVIDAATNTVVTTIGVGYFTNPYAIAISPDGSTIYVGGNGSNILLIDAATNAVIDTVSGGNIHYGIAVSPDGYKVYTSNYNNNNVSVLTKPVSYFTIADTTCESYTFFNSTYTESGIYSHIIPGGNSVGCDSIITLNLTIKNAAHSTLGTWQRNYVAYTQEAWGLTTDASGNIYVARPDYGDIRKITPGGDTSTFASGFYNSPTDITTDDNGNFYIAMDDGNPVKLDANGNYLSDLATLSGGYGNICRDNSGNTYVAHGWNGIKKIAPDGTVTTLLAANPDYMYPGGSIAADGNGNIYASQYNNGNVLKITPLGEVDTFATGLSHPKGVTIDADGNVYVVSESYNLYKITPVGILTVLMPDALYGWGITTDGRGGFYATDGNTGVHKILQEIQACGSYVFGGNSLTDSGTYQDTIAGGASNGCDSIVTLNLLIHSIARDTVNITECDSFIWRTHTYTASGFYRDTVTGAAAHGCDSIYNLNLTIFHASSTSIVDSICADSTYNFNGVMLTAAGTYYDTLTNANGCDSVITLTLSIKTSDCIPTGIDNVAKNRISLSPNPSSGLFTVVSDIAENGLIEVYAVTGTKVYSKNALSLSKNEINLSDQAKGVYVVKVSNAETVWTQRVLVE